MRVVEVRGLGRLRQFLDLPHRVYADPGTRWVAPLWPHVLMMMGWPVGPEYAASSNVTNAHKLTGKLLLTVGELDRNVDPASTMQVADALIRADKDFDLLIIPGGGHGSGTGNPYGRRKTEEFFVRHLLNGEKSPTTATSLVAE